MNRTLATVILVGVLVSGAGCSSFQTRFHRAQQALKAEQLIRTNAFEANKNAVYHIQSNLSYRSAQIERAFQDALAAAGDNADARDLAWQAYIVDRSNLEADATHDLIVANSLLEEANALSTTPVAVSGLADSEYDANAQVAKSAIIAGVEGVQKFVADEAEKAAEEERKKPKKSDEPQDGIEG